MEFEPKIVAFLCNWCSYTGADLAGTSRMKYPANIKIIRIMCSGRIGPTFVLKAFREGADGVMICGCHPGDCHYHEGNYKCLRRYKLIQKYIQQMGIEQDRLRLSWISASEGKQFAELAQSMTEVIRELGPCDIKSVMETFA
ncbi:MAG: hydrogenase iron-sulfur subunit [Bacteroidetes bacterium]|jgi:F420-non-reducing hydrogenase iron-sulfur subunit|nr:hydrogenase iron-sulfur subunit [Bacteroidota bacterium]MBT4399237.1 hydrogenase iron-sulfur subunit [Bacteroidota bacterium]MBT4409979.1 hydrogenase iron-sulfur subunit [Bacteroidota bacterium]MBT5425455.1 hydrogenase iron-sulfur subunit [Bacteroidota bacterium]MBT7095427.1 hydrogenase iron-sulfur subunit [Bacteroidota bacterium]